MERHTFYGTVIDYKDLSHQHLSNILWYNELLLNGYPDSYAFRELNERFGGIRLPYSPVPSFNWEIDTLFELGYITNKRESEVVVNGRWVGKLKYN